MQKLWVEKYRPKKLNEYVFRDENQKKQIHGWVKEGSIPHLLLSGSPGIGKTTLSKVLINELDVNDLDIIEVNASRETGIDFIREKIVPFISRIPFGPFKVVLLDEADRLSPQAQDSLKGIIEEYSDFARFILTTNRPNKIMPPLHSRCQQMHFASIDQTEFTARAATILVEEGIDFDLDNLDTYVKVTYPDLRKCINLLQQHCVDGRLINPSTDDTGTADYKLEMVELFKKGKINEARKLVCGRALPEEIDELYRWLYDNVAIFGNEEMQNKAILIIKQGAVDHSLVVDPEINLAATLIRLAHL
jgi:DNA polymerase III delta prime subunit